jgi:hypothetical protein
VGNTGLLQDLPFKSNAFPALGALTSAPLLKR